MATLSLQEAFAQALTHQAENRPSDAIALYRDITGCVPTEWAPWNNMFYLLAIEGKKEDALSVLAEAARWHPEAVRDWEDILEDLWPSREPLPVAGSVVVPAYKAASFLPATLDSILAAIRALEASLARTAWIVVVDDASTDQTAAVVHAWARERGFQNFRLLVHTGNRGPGAARNAGVRAAEGALIWFLDADDAYAPSHLVNTATALDRRPDAGFARSGVIFDGIDDRILPHWRTQCETSIPINLCVRRVCQDYIGGFPEETAFRTGGGEDCAQARLLQRFFRGVQLDARTVLYRRRPGNAFDQQVRKFTGEEVETLETLPRGLVIAQRAGLVLAERRFKEIARRAPDASVRPFMGSPPASLST
ncbi:glycosyltransferase family 2 protein [Pararhodospirillum oryzae]|uniref:Glycosyltransferase 2-like domain-containing protein n=1 Tax=Pararhodospirillum oryzae TaxID=478448 RepID=A0A512H6U0_9PROT|nr:glycosyltransferase family 2 protein [Pararhodospirillum oryzae]GEO81154.1 hypothetical protein ROR02_12850 [Pararhodospirillum oryzae]